MVQYDRALWKVNNFFFVPKHFFTPDILEKRKPLSPNAKRAGWTGCNIRLSDIPQAGRIMIIQNSQTLDEEDVLKKGSSAEALYVSEMIRRSWLFDIMRYIDLLEGERFSLSDIYNFEYATSLNDWDVVVFSRETARNSPTPGAFLFAPGLRSIAQRINKKTLPILLTRRTGHARLLSNLFCAI